MAGRVPEPEGEEPVPGGVAEETFEGVAEPRFETELCLPVRTLVKLVHRLGGQPLLSDPQVHPLPKPPRAHPLGIVAVVADGDDAEGGSAAGQARSKES